MLSQGGRGGGQKLPILLSKETTKRGGGGQKSPILRRHSLWTAPYDLMSEVEGGFFNILTLILVCKPRLFENSHIFFLTCSFDVLAQLSKIAEKKYLKIITKNTNFLKKNLVYNIHMSFSAHGVNDTVNF